MIQTKPLTGQCAHCGAPAEKLAYHSRYTVKNGRMVRVIRCKRRKGTSCDCYGTAFYDLKTPEEKVERAIHQGLEGLCPEAVVCIERVHPTYPSPKPDSSAFSTTPLVFLPTKNFEIKI